MQTSDGSSRPVELITRVVARACTKAFVVTVRPFFPVSATVVLRPDGQVLETLNAAKLGLSDAELAGKGGALLSSHVHRGGNGGGESPVEYVIASKASEPVLTRLSVAQSDERVTLDFERVDQSFEAVFALDGEGRVRDCSRFFAPRMTGYTREQLLGQSINLVVPSLFPVAPSGVSFSCEGVHSEGHALFLSLVLTRIAGGNFCCQMRRHTVASPQEAPNASPVPAIPGMRAGALLGSGAFSCVKLGRSEGTDQRLSAVKFIAQKHANSALKEVGILRTLDHHAIPKLHFVAETASHVAIAMEFCPGIELGNYIKTRGWSLPEAECKHYFRQLCSAVAYIHACGVVHRDLKTENVLVLPGAAGGASAGGQPEWRRNQIKLIDFGLSVKVQSGAMQTVFCGTPAYAAPEILALKPYHGPEIDVWSMGIVLYVMLMGKFPFASVRSVIEMPFPEDLVKNICCANLLSNILQKDPAARVTVSQIMAHSWLSECDNIRFVRCRVLGEKARGDEEPCYSESTEDAAHKKRSRLAMEERTVRQKVVALGQAGSSSTAE